MRTVRYLEEAREELLHEVEYFTAVSPRLGERFDKAVQKAEALAAEIAAKPPQALRLTKRLLQLAQRSELPDFLETCASFQAISHQTQDHAEAVNAFIGKRKGSYTGS